jgi:hypothetical protein
LPKNDEGEFELVLGNRQLISVFVIVVALLGVFFSMGYIVGRNSSVAAAVSDPARGDTHPPESSTDRPTPGEPSAGQPLPASASPDDSAPPATSPATSEPERAAATPPAVKSAPAPARETKPRPFPSRDETPVPDRAPVTGQIAGGQYWQVVATTRPDAEIIAEALAKRGFHSVLAPAPKEGMFRVLVGPLGDAPTQAQTRTNLEAVGFKNPIMRKY